LKSLLISRHPDPLARGEGEIPFNLRSNTAGGGCVCGLKCKQGKTGPMGLVGA